MPVQSQGQDRFARDGQDRRQVPGQGQRPAQGQGQDRGFGDRGRDNGRPGSQRPNNGGYGQRGGMDKDDYVPSAPKEKFQVQPIVRSQTPKGGDGQPKKKGAVRVVDTRTTEVDLSKYDERLDTFVTETERDLRDGSRGGKKQQIGKQAAKNQKGGKKQQPVVKQVVRLEIPEEISVAIYLLLWRLSDFPSVVLLLQARIPYIPIPSATLWSLAICICLKNARLRT